MSVEILEREASQQPHFEVLVDSVNDLRLLYDGLTNTIADQRVSQRNFDDSNEHKLELAESLREQIAKDFEANQHGEKPGDFRYTIEDSRFVLEALEVAQEAKEPAVDKPSQQKNSFPEYAWLYDAKSTHVADRYNHVKSIDDPRLNQRRSLWRRK